MVHVYISTGRFATFEEARDYVDKRYTEDGDGMPSAFILETKLENYEPGFIEAILSKSGSPVPLSELLRGSSWGEQWIPRLDGSRLADAAICVFTPNQVGNPAGSSLDYVGPLSTTMRPVLGGNSAG